MADEQHTQLECGSDVGADSSGGARGGAQTGCRPQIPNVGAYVVAALSFMVLVNIRDIDAVGVPLTGNLLPSSMRLQSLTHGRLILEVMWCLHYFRRCLEVVFVHVYHRKSPVGEGLGAVAYYMIFGAFIGWSMSSSEYRVPHSGFLCPGIAIFIISEAGNCWCHVKLRQMRASPSPSVQRVQVSGRTRSMSSGMFFDHVTCPHYLFELGSWLGFFLASFTLASFLLFAFSVLVLFLRARSSHQELKAAFDGKDGVPLYPPHRKAIIPFVF